MFDIRPGCRLLIGSGTTINSRNFGYHAGLFSPVKLMADGQDAFIEIGSDCRIHGSTLHAKGHMKIGNRCLIAANCQIMDSNGHDLCLENPDDRLLTTGTVKPVTIGNSVWVGERVIVLPGVTIGDGSVIAARSVVTRDVPPGSLASGNPAQVLRSA